MGRANLRKLVRRHSAARKRVVFLPGASSRRQFLSDKRAYLEGLNEALRSPTGHMNAIHPMLKKCLVRLNRLSFLFTRTSDGPKSYSLPKGLNINGIRIPPTGKNRFRFVGPHIEIELDGSKRSFLFWQKVAELVKRYPKAVMIPAVPSPMFDLISSFRKGKSIDLFSKSQLKLKLAEAWRFFKELEQIADEFLCN